MVRGVSLSAPRRLLALFVAVTVLPGLALAWLGWQLFEQDRSLTGQRVQERLDREVVRIAADLDDWLARIETDLPTLVAAPDRGLGAGALFIEIDGERIAARPVERLLYRPARTVALADTGSVFASGEVLELKRRNLAGAIENYRTLAGDHDESIRAGALLRLARSERKLGQLEQALDHYAELAGLGQVELAGGPADLLARQARLAVLAEIGDASSLATEARSLAVDLLRANWTLDRAAFELHLNKVRTLLEPLDPEDTGLTVPPDLRLLAETVDTLVRQFRSADRMASRSTIESPAGMALVVLNQPIGPLRAFVATSEHVRELWEDGWRDRGLAVQLVSANNRPFVSTDELIDRRAVSLSGVNGLPWDVSVAYLDPTSAFAELGARRRLLLIGFGLILLVVFGGGYFAVRGMSRELAAARLQTDFVSAVSHEFRSPLTSMRHVAELLAEGAVPTESRRSEYYGLLLAQTERLHRLVTNLLDFRRLESGAYEYHFDDVDLGDLAARVIDDFEQLSPGSHSVQRAVAADLPPVRADSEAIARALWNLLDNAAKYSPGSPAIGVTVALEAGRIEIRVADSGIGIPADEQDKIFRKFFRGRRTEASRIEGAGIGLTMVRQIVEAHGGRVEVRSEPGAGTTFTLSLPIGARP